VRIFMFTGFSLTAIECSSNMDSVDITRLLTRIRQGDNGARDDLIAALYPDLHAIASRLMRHEAVGNTLQATAIVNEAYIRLAESNPVKWENRAHFLGVAAEVMRHILVDHARAKHADCRGGPSARRLPIEGLDIFAEENFEQLLEINEALTALSEEDLRAARVLEAHAFGGLSLDEISAYLAVSQRTVKRDLRYARAWVYDWMNSKVASQLP
jgi:RNA polymerase sigma-70 factor, ECF subfamily